MQQHSDSNNLLHRPLGYWETLNALVHDELAGHGNSACLIELTESIDFNLLKTACNIIFNEQPLLRATYKRYDSHYELSVNAEFTSIDVSLNKFTDSVAAYNSFLRTPFNAETSLWRIALIINKDKTWLIIGLHHAIGDGLSLANIANRLLEICYLSSEAKPSVKLIPAIENQINPQHFKTLSTNFFEQNSFDENKIKHWPYAQKAQINDRATGHVFKTIPSEFLTQLKKVAKKTITSINSLLNAALLKSLAQMNHGEINTTLCTPINLRQYVDPIIPNDQLGCLVTMVMTHHHVAADDNILLLAKNYEQALKNSISQAGQYPATFSINDLKTYADRCKLDKHEFFMGFGISNLGQLYFSPGVDNKIKSFYCSASRQAADFAGLLAAATVNNQLFIDYSFTIPEMDTRYMENLAILCEEQLLKTISEP